MRQEASLRRATLHVAEAATASAANEQRATAERLVSDRQRREDLMIRNEEDDRLQDQVKQAVRKQVEVRETQSTEIRQETVRDALKAERLRQQDEQVLRNKAIISKRASDAAIWVQVQQNLLRQHLRRMSQEFDVQQRAQSVAKLDAAISLAKYLLEADSKSTIIVDLRSAPKGLAGEDDHLLNDEGGPDSIEIQVPRWMDPHGALPSISFEGRLLT
jgi:hypothetical protein